MRDNPCERPPLWLWEATFVKEPPYQRQPLWKSTLMTVRDHPCERLTLWLGETTPLKDQPYEGPPLWKTTLMTRRDHPCERPTLMRDLPCERPPLWGTTPVRDYPFFWPPNFRSCFQGTWPEYPSCGCCCSHGQCWRGLCFCIIMCVCVLIVWTVCELWMKIVWWRVLPWYKWSSWQGAQKPIICDLPVAPLLCACLFLGRFFTRVPLYSCYRVTVFIWLL